MTAWWSRGRVQIGPEDAAPLVGVEAGAVQGLLLGRFPDGEATDEGLQGLSGGELAVVLGPGRRVRPSPLAEEIIGLLAEPPMRVAVHPYAAAPVA